MTTKNAPLQILALLALAAPAWAQGLLIPNEPDLPPLGIRSHRVRAELHGQAAQTTIEQVFVNHTNRNLEAQFVFPIPRGASLSRFTMIVNGREQAGELVDRDQARQIYSSIVNRAQDPGLLEYLGGQLFRASVFPIAPGGTQTLTLRYEQVLDSRDGLVRYVHPLRADGRKAAAVEGETAFEVHVRAPAPLLNLYSPSHPVSVQRLGDAEARVTWSDRRGALDRDFQLLFSMDPREIGLNLLTYRPDPAQPGYFLMLTSPRSALQSTRLVERDLVFVIDTSGSMAGAKIKQAREALKHLVAKLNDGDRFTMISFSSDVDPWRRELVPARERRAEALRWADALLAQGGTNISGALDLALSLPNDPARPAYVVFMTDGKPTMGDETAPARILQRAARARAGRPGSLRLFTWGVGYDVDTPLLDGLATQAGGVSEYVRPEEDIAVKVAAFADRAGQPVLAGLDLKVLGERVKLSNALPRTLPDLFAGQQVVLAGRYTGDGDVALQLDGQVNGNAQRFVYEGRFPAFEARNAFVEILWAQRRIGDLLDQIRFHGESKELVDDVKRLSAEYGIPTPYTSALILEDAARPAAKADLGNRFRRDVASGGVRSAAPPPGPAAEEAKRMERGWKARDGKDAVEFSDRLRRLKEEGRPESAEVRRASGARFRLHQGIWVDERFEAKDAILEIAFGGAAQFRLLELRPELAEALKLGVAVVVRVAPGKSVIVGADDAAADAAALEAFLR
jgi:Ca-activated chloride channel family protein